MSFEDGKDGGHGKELCVVSGVALSFRQALLELFEKRVVIKQIRDEAEPRRAADGLLGAIVFDCLGPPRDG